MDRAKVESHYKLNYSSNLPPISFLDKSSNGNICLIKLW